MNLTKRTLCIIMALAVVFTTLVFVSVGASVDFPIHNTIVSLSGGNTQNCNQSKPQYEGNNKIAYASAEGITIDATISADASNLKTLVQQSEYVGEFVSIDLYAEFESSLDNTRVAAAVNFGGGDVIPSAKNTNVTSPTAEHSVDFVNHKIVTLKLWVDDILTGRSATLDDLTSVSITVFPEKKEVVTGTFFFSAPYIESNDGANISTVDITSIKTTTTKAEEKYDGNIVVYDSGVKFTGKHNYVQSMIGGVADSKATTVYYGDTQGFEGAYLHMDGSGQQLQLGEAELDGLEQLRERASAEGKSVCIDIYANGFTNGNYTNAQCDLQMRFSGGSNIGDDSDRKVIKSGIKQTIVFSASAIPENCTKLNITFQNYSYGDYKSITNAQFIITAPYVEGDASSSAFTPSTTTVPTTTTPEDISYSEGGQIVAYNNGVTYTGSKSWIKPTTIDLQFCNAFFADQQKATEVEPSSEVVDVEAESSESESSEVGSSEVGSSESESTTVKGKTIEKAYYVVSGNGTTEWGGQQIQLNSLGVNGLAELKARAEKNNESICVDIYSTGLPSNCYFKLGFNGGGKTTGDYDRLLSNNKKQTIVFDSSYIAEESSSMNFWFLNYSFGSKTVSGTFIVSVPYIKSDFEVPVVNGTTGVTVGASAANDVSTSAAEADGSATTASTNPEVDYETDELPLKIKDSVVTYNASGSWGNPESGYKLANDKKSSSIYTASTYQNIQMCSVTNNLDKLILDAIDQDKNIAIDFYGNFLSKGKDVSKAKLKVAVGGYWYGGDPDNANADDVSKMMDIYPKQVTTVEINPKKLLETIKSKSTTTAADTSIKHVESLAYTGIKPGTDSSDSTKVMHTITNPTVGQYIEYTIPNLEAGTYDISMATKDYTNRGVYNIYANGELLKAESFYSSSTAYNDHSIGQYKLEAAGNLVIKVEYKNEGTGGGSQLYLDYFKVKNTADVTQAPTAADDASIAANTFKSVHIQIWGGNGYSDVTTYGRFYMSVPYIVGATEGEAVEGITTTTTWSLPITSGKKFTSVNDIDFGYVDCKYDVADWAANGSNAERVFNNKVYKITNKGTQQQQVGARLNVNGGSITKDFASYIKYAKNAGAKLAIDVYPSFSMSDSGSLYCHMNTTWYKTGNNNYNNEAENLTSAGDVEVEYYSLSDDENYDGSLGEYEAESYAKFANVEVDQKIEYTISDVTPGTYTISAPSLQSANGGTFKIAINGEKKEKVDFSNDTLAYSTKSLAKHQIKASSNSEETIVVDDTCDVTITFICKKAGDLILDKINLAEENLVWPTNNKAFKLTPGTKFTYYIDPYDIPEGSSKFEVYFDSYEYAPGWRAMQNVEIYMTAPYLADGTFDESKTTVTTTSSTSTTKATVSASTYAYPSSNKGGKTRFYISDVNIAPGGTIKVPVMISGNQGLYSAKFSLKFNPNDLDFKDYTNGSVFENVSVNTDKVDSDGIIDIMLQSSKDTTANGALLYLEFDVTSVEGDYPISFAGTGYYPSNFFNYNGKNVPCSFGKGYVLVDSTGTRTRTPDANAYQNYPTTNSGTTKFTIDSVSETYVAGTNYRDFEVNISVSGNAGLSSAKFTVQYDTSKLKFLSSTPAKNTPAVFNLVDYNLTPIEYDPGILTYNIDVKDEKIATNSKNNGKIVTLKFRVLKYAVGTYSVSFGGETYDAKGFLNLAGNKVPCSFQSGGFTVKAPTVSKTALSTVKLVDKTTAQLTWSAVSTATSYRIFRAVDNANSFIQIADVKGTTYTDTTLLGGKQYTYKVVAVNAYVTSDASNAISVVTMDYATKPVVKAVKLTNKNKKIKVSLKNAVKGAAGYEVKYSTTKKFKNKTTKTLTMTKLSKKFKSKLTKQINKLSANKKYFVKVRAYSVINGKKVYGKWSKVKIKKVK